MGFVMKVSPRFSVNEIISESIEKDWINFQAQANSLGAKILAYLQSYINLNRKRLGGTGKLASSMTLEYVDAPGTVGWGIGNMSLLDDKVPYWYVVNYGKMKSGKKYVPYHGKGLVGKFSGSNPPDSSMSGHGFESFSRSQGGFLMRPKSPIRPMNYIQATRKQLNKELATLIASLKVI